MRIQNFQLLVLLGLPLSITSSPSPLARLPLPNKIVYQFPNPTWIESIDVRSNGQLLLGLLTTPDLYSLDASSPDQTPELLYRFPGITGVFGITEISPDIFVVAGGNFSLATLTSVPYTYAVWKVDFTSKKSPPRISKIVDLKEALWLNGVEALPGCPGNVLIADSSLGAIWKLDINTKKYEIVIKVPEMDPVPGAAALLGVNGIHVHTGYLYWSNTNTATLYRAKIDKNGRLVRKAKIEKLATDPILMDDFIVDKKGIAWVSTNFGNSVLAVQDGKVKTVVGSLTELTVAGDTAVRFGRGRKDRETLYVVTGGALGSPVNGTITEGGKVVAIDTKGFRI